MNPYKEFTRLGNVTIQRIQPNGEKENISSESSTEKPKQSSSDIVQQNYLNYRLPPGIDLTIKPINDTTKTAESTITQVEDHKDESKETPDDQYEDSNKIQVDTQSTLDQSEASRIVDNSQSNVGDKTLVNKSPKSKRSDKSSNFSTSEGDNSEESDHASIHNNSRDKMSEAHENTDEEMIEENYEETTKEYDNQNDELSKENADSVSQEQSDPCNFENQSDEKCEFDDIVDPESIIIKAETIDDFDENGIEDEELNDDMQMADANTPSSQENDNHEKNESNHEKDSSEKMDQGDDGDDEMDEEDEGESKKKKRTQSSEEETDDSSKGKKKRKKSSGKGSASDSDSEDKSAAEMKVGNMRRNIREVMDETKLEEATLNAQRQEMERLRRVQEQQKIIRDALQAQRQIAVNRQNNKTQARVLSLLQGGSTSLIRKGSEEDVPLEPENKKPNTVVVKLSTGSGPPQLVNRKMLDLLKNQNSAPAEVETTSSDNRLKNLSKNLDKPHMMTASVSIAPVKPGQRKKPEEDKAKEKQKDKSTVTVSSSDEDDCIVISGPSDEEEIAEEDPSNSGMHTSDIYNVPDDQGRVLINVGHPPNESDVFLAPQIARIIKPHQIGGVRFLFDNIVESIDRYKTSEGFGCILAHSMGLGKTLQVISFCDVFLRYTDGKSILCIMPINTLQNWLAEFNMWLPSDAETSPFKEDGEVVPRKFPLFVLNDNQKTMSARASVIENWHKEGGVLLIGYELYRQLSLKKPRKPRRSANKKTEQKEEEDELKSKNLLNEIHEALVKPGPDLVICDEGHRIKNSHASISQALKQIRSKRRVVLTGYPLQNNLLEYWCMVDFVRPNYLGTKTEFSNMFERPIQNGQCIDSTPQDIKLMRYRAHVLHSLLQGFVQRRSHAVLQQTLPQKYEYVLLLRLTSFQRKLYNTFMNDVVRTKAVPNPLKAFAVCCKIWNHPDILYNFLKKRAGEEDIDLDLDETVGCSVTPSSDPSTPSTPSTPPTSLPSKRTRGRGARGGSTAREPRSRKNVKIKAEPIADKLPETPQPTETGQFEPPSPYGNQQYSSSQSTPTEMSYDGNQYPTFTPPTTITPSPTTNFTENPYYQQSYDTSFYQGGGGGGYGQNNYWQANDNNTGYYNAPSSSTDNYYNQGLPPSQGQYSNTNDGNSPYYQTRMPSTYPNSNFQMRQETPMLRGLTKTASEYNLQSDQIKIKEELSSESSASSDATLSNFNQTFNMQDIKPNVPQTMDMVSSLRAMQPQSSSQMGFIGGRGSQTRAQTIRGTTRRGRRPRAGSTLGRPPLIRNNDQFTDYSHLPQTPQPFNPSFSNQNDPNNALIHQNLSDLFKPGLLGGAKNFQGSKPTISSNFQTASTPDNDGQINNPMINTSFHYGQDSLNPTSQLNPGFLNTLTNDNIWGGFNNIENPGFPNDPNMQMFNTPNNLMHNIHHSPYYSDPATNNVPMMTAPTSSNALFTDTQHYLPPPPPSTHNEYPNSLQTPDQGLFNLSQFSNNYLNDLQSTTPLIRPLAQYTQCTDRNNAYMGLLTGLDAPDQSMTTSPQTNSFTNFSQNQKFPSMNFVGQTTPNSGDLSTPKPNYDSLYPTFTGKTETVTKEIELGPKNDNIYDNQFSSNYLIGNNQQTSLQNIGNDKNTTICESSIKDTSNDFLDAKNSDSLRLPSLNFFQNSQNLTLNKNDYQRPPQEFVGNTDSSWDLNNVSMEGKDGMKRVIEPVNDSKQQINTFNNYDDQDNLKEEPDTKPQPPSTASILKEIDERYFGKNRGTGGSTDNVAGKSVLSSLVSDNEKKSKLINNEDKHKKIIDSKEEELEEGEIRMPVPDMTVTRSAKEEPIPYEWANEFFNDYEPGKLEASAKIVVFFCMLHEIILLGDRLLLFSQSLFTLDLIEDFLQIHNVPGKEEKWMRNINYYRLDGSTTACERERLINEFNINTDIHLFLVSTRAGSLGINLVGANRVIVFDASWNPCHDTQAVCRVYRYGQEKPCYVYRFVMDHCLEKKIYDRQINKQGMSDRVVDECNPDAHLTIKDVTNLCWDSGDECESKDFTETIDKYADVVVKKIIEKYSSLLSKEPFQHESLLIDRKDKQLSLAEKRMAKRSYELEKRANIRPSYGVYGANNSNMMRKPMSGIRPMQNNMQFARDVRKWIPAEVWQKQGMNAQEMTLPLDVVIPTNTGDTRASIVLKAGQKVMVLRSPKGIYMQLENGKIIAIKTQLKNTASNNNKSTSSIGPVRANVSHSNNIRQLRNVLSARKDITLAPVRNRMMIPGGIRHNSFRSTRPHHAVGRNLPLPRPRHHIKTSIGNKMFGPNSPVTITVSKTKTESASKPPMDIKSNVEKSVKMNNREDEVTQRRKDKEIDRNRLSDDTDDDNMCSRQEITGSPPTQTEVKEDTPKEVVGKTDKCEQMNIIDDNKRNKELLKSDRNQQVEQQLKVNKELTLNKIENKIESKFVIPESLRMSKSINLTPITKEPPSPVQKAATEQKTIPEEMKNATSATMKHKSNSISIMPVTKSPGRGTQDQYYSEYPSPSASASASSSHFMNYYPEQNNSQFLPPPSYNPFSNTSNTFNTTQSTTRPDFRSNQYDNSNNNYQQTYDSFNQLQSPHYGNQSTSTNSFDPYTQYNQYYDNYNNLQQDNNNSYRSSSQPPPQSPQNPKQ